MGQTLLTIRTRIQDDLDLHDEQFISPSEIDARINDAIRDAGSLIQAIYEDYFLEITYLPVVSGTSEYPLPSNMFANKIRRFQYEKDSTMFKILRVTDLNELPLLSSSTYTAVNFFKYVLINKELVGMVLKMFPTPTEDTTLGLMIARANLLKATINAHFADATQHTTAADTINTITTEDAYDEYTLYNLLEAMLLAYDTHESDAELASNWVYHRAQESSNHSLASIVKPLNLTDALTRITDMQTKSNAHDADATTHALGSLHQQTGSDITDVGNPFKVYFIRRPKLLVNDTDETDIPEFENYVLNRSKEYVLEKDIGNPMLQKVMQCRMEQEKLLQETLSNRILDDQAELRLDYENYGAYDDSVGGF